MLSLNELSERRPEDVPIPTLANVTISESLRFYKNKLSWQFYFLTLSTILLANTDTTFIYVLFLLISCAIQRYYCELFCAGKNGRSRRAQDCYLARLSFL